MTRNDASDLAIGQPSRCFDWQAALAEHERWLRTVAYSRLGEREAVDEVLQEVALAAVRQASPLRDTAKVAPWLYRLVVRQVLLYRRRQGRERKLKNRYALLAPRAAPDTDSDDPLDWLIADERRASVRKALKRLRERDIEILLLKYTENWSYRQIASRLGVSHGAVESRLHRARNRLRAELATLNIVEATK